MYTVYVRRTNEDISNLNRDQASNDILTTLSNWAACVDQFDRF